MKYNQPILNDYKEFLNRSNIKGFDNRMKNEPESLYAEAVVYSFLKTHCDDVQRQEQKVVGGVDFSCTTQGERYVVEVTSFNSESVTSESGLPNEEPQKTEVRSYSGIASKLFYKAISKVKQVSNYSCPRLLVITSDHAQADSVMDKLAAKTLLIGEQFIPIPSSPSATKLENSVFYQIDVDKLVPCHTNISAIILGSIKGGFVSFVGALHPNPEYPFNINLLPKVPFVGPKSFSEKDNKLIIEWHQDRSHGIGYTYFYPRCEE